MPLDSDLPHSPADILRELLILLDLGTDPDIEQNVKVRVWPVHAKSEPNEPDNCITTYSTSNQADGRSGHDGSIWEHYGWQVRVRGKIHGDGYKKGNRIRNTLAQVHSQLVTVPDEVGTATHEYLVESITEIGPLLDLNNEQTTKRFLFTINGMMTIEPNPT